MKVSKIPTILSAISMIVLLCSSYFCYSKINKKVNTIESTPNTQIITTTSAGAQMNVSTLDMLNKNNVVIGTSNAVINVYYKNDSKEYLEFELVYKSSSTYNKTKGVDGIDIKEYTYEIAKNNVVVEPEKELVSFEEGDEIVLSHLKTNEENNDYVITFRFYTSHLDQNHLIGKSLNGSIFVKII